MSIASRPSVLGSRYIPLKVASFAMGALRPFFQVLVPSESTDFGGEQFDLHKAGCSAASCQASVQAGRYDKWEVRKEIEEEIKSVRLACSGSLAGMNISHDVRIYFASPSPRSNDDVILIALGL